MKIGILQTGHSPDTMVDEFGDYGDLFVQLLDGQGLSFEIFSVVDSVFPGSITDAEGWLITGSRYGAYEDHDWIPPLEDFLRAAFKAEIPIVGICFGHQILAQALGGKVAKYDGGWTVGPTEYQMNGSKTMLNAWHQDQVIERPTGAKVIGTAAHCENAMLAYGDTALTIQAHPEISNSFVKGLVDGRGRGRVPDTLLDQALERLSEPIAQQAFATKMADFFKQPR
ncbi:MAG: GMP synthase-like glutamine amidotransferase [Paracoccaceae bacterium]|jgi:GMP synthase-like glutamine amidotransferase